MNAKPIVLMLHSFGADGDSWLAVRSRLSQDSAAPDLPGFGDASPLARPSIAAYADWVVDVISGIERDVVLVGASMGGKIAMAVAARRPDHLRGLVLCAPSPPTEEPIKPEERRRRLGAWGQRLEANRSVSEATLTPPGDEIFERAVKAWLKTDRATWDWWWSEGSRETIDVDAVAPGAVILAGDMDTHLGPNVQRETTAMRLAGATVRVVKGSRHLLALDRPDAVASAIESACQ